MPPRSLRAVLKRVYGLLPPPGQREASDAALLERFLTQRDECAFELLVWRHGPLVLGACRRVLRHEQDAEDAFQATFLTLARKAASIGKGASVGCWLCKVAYRSALRVKQAARRRQALLDEWPPLEVDTTEPAELLARQEIGPVLDEEIARLPQHYRDAFVLCYLEGKTNAEAGELLGCPKGTVLSRLARARERLRRPLTVRHSALAAPLTLPVAPRSGPARGSAHERDAP
jgi:RNA polymerase sigma factor (sigma-70 family)